MQYLYNFPYLPIIFLSAYLKAVSFLVALEAALLKLPIPVIQCIFNHSSFPPYHHMSCTT